MIAVPMFGSSCRAIVASESGPLSARASSSTMRCRSGKVGQVIEIAAGLSPRGWSFMQRYGERLRYIEPDLPAMAACQRDILTQTGFLSDRHRIVQPDALAERGPDSLAPIPRKLDPHTRTATITEGPPNNPQT